MGWKDMCLVIFGQTPNHLTSRPNCKNDLQSISEKACFEREVEVELQQGWMIGCLWMHPLTFAMSNLISL